MTRRTILVVAAFWVSVLAIGVFGIARRLSSEQPVIDNSVGVWFLSDAPALARYEEHNKAFGETEWSVLVLKTGSIWNRDFLGELARLDSTLDSIPHVREVVSLSGIVGTSPPDPTFRRRILSSDYFQRTLVRNGDTTTTGILIKTDNKLRDPSPYRLRMVDTIRAAVSRMRTVHEHALAGTSVINAELNRSAKRDALRFYVLVTLLVVAIGYATLGNVKDLAIVCAVLLVAVLGPMGAIALQGIRYNMVTILLPPVLVSLSVCDVVHLIQGFHQDRRNLSADLAMRAVLRRFWWPCFWTSTVTILGTLSMALSSVAPIRHMGLYSSLGLALAWMSTMTLGPALLVAFWTRAPRAAAPSTAPGRYGQKLVPFLKGRWRWLWIGIAILLTIPVTGLGRLRIDTDYSKFFAEDTPLSRSYGIVSRADWPQNILSIDVRRDPSTVSDSVFLRTIGTLERKASALGKVRKTLSRASLRTEIGIPANAPDSVERRIPAFADFSDPAGVRSQILVFTPYLGSRELVALREQVAALSSALPSGIQASLEGTTMLWADMDSEIGRTQVWSFLALALVFVVLLPILFGSWKLGFLAMVVNGLPLAMTFGLMGWCGVEINMATALIGGVSIGSTVDSTIFFVNRFKAALQAGRDRQQAIDEAVSTVGDGILVTTIILAGGFACMTISGFKPTAYFGLFTTLTILSAAFLDLVVNPVLIGLLWKIQTPSSPSERV